MPVEGIAEYSRNNNIITAIFCYSFHRHLTISRLINHLQLMHNFLVEGNTRYGIAMCCYRRDAVTNVPESHKCDSMHHATKPLSPNPVYSASHLHNAQKQQHPPVNPMLNCPPVNQMLHYCGKVYEFKSTRHVY